MDDSKQPSSGELQRDAQPEIQDDQEKKAIDAEKQYYTKLHAPSRITEIEMRKLIFLALSEESPENTPRKETFKQHSYRGSIDDLRPIVEHFAIKNGLIEQVVEIKFQTWDCPGEIPHYMDNTNFNLAELDVFNEEIYCLLFQNVISVGSSAGFGMLPFFHVTTLGKKCLEEGKYEILPFDQDDYLSSIKKYNPNDWEEFYVSEALRCYNCGAYSAAITMLGILGEYIAEQLISALDMFLAKNEPTLQANFNTELSKHRFISNKYGEYETMLDQVVNSKDPSGQNWKYPSIRNITPKLDGPTKKIYNTYVRLTRNSLAHPTDLRMERAETLMLFISFTKYFQIQHKYLDEFKSLS